MSSTTATFNNLSPEERAKLVRAALAAETEEKPAASPLKISDPKHPANITQESTSRELWLYIFQDALAEEHVTLERQAEITRAAFNRRDEQKLSEEKRIVSKLVKNLSVGDEVSLMEEIQKAIKQAEEQNQFMLLRKLLAVYLELEKITKSREE